jgi:cyclic pyranopterin phosphate synthase
VDSGLTHLDEHGTARMVDVGAKAVSERWARARATVRLTPETAALVRSGDLPKGDVVAVTRIAAIQAAKRTADLIPLCHPLPLTHVDVEVEVGEDAVEIVAAARTTGQTGVEMEALTAASVGALTVYDMVKGVERGVTIERVELLDKTGGKSGEWHRA